MKIIEICTNRAPFEGERVTFTPGANIIRGENGSGKTTLLEYASLLGHVCLMRFHKLKGVPPISMKVDFSPSDRRFFKSIMHNLQAKSVEAYRKLLEDQLSVSIETLAGWPGFGVPSELSFFFDDGSDNVDLKSVLASDVSIRRDLIVSGDEMAIRVIKAINLWSRPERRNDSSWTTTPRFIHSSLAGEGIVDIPATVFYVNTDMYEFGVGLDIRESPKELKGSMTSVLINRLQLVRTEQDVFQYNLVSDSIEDNQSRLLLCDAELKRLWKVVFGDEHRLTKGEVKRVEGKHRDLPDQFEWHFSIGIDSQGAKDAPQFVSSGQNQALFVLSQLCGLAVSGSCMLFDEPELHLTFKSGSLLMQQIIEHCATSESQAIIVTHLPHLYRGQVKDFSEVIWKDTSKFNYRHIRMIYVDQDAKKEKLTFDTRAMNDAARSSYEDVERLIDGLKLDKAVNKFPRPREILEILRLV